jgi:hypothetical protein
MKPCIIKFLTLFFSTMLLSSCLYQQPDEDFLQEIPTTNNPDITREKNSFGVPV